MLLLLLLLLPLPTPGQEDLLVAESTIVPRSPLTSAINSLTDFVRPLARLLPPSPMAFWARVSRRLGGPGHPPKAQLTFRRPRIRSKSRKPGKVRAPDVFQRKTVLFPPGRPRRPALLRRPPLRFAAINAAFLGG